MDQWNLRAQGSMEFMIIFGFLLVMFISMLSVISINSNVFSKERITLQTEDLITKLQKEILLASKVQDGYSRTFHVPEKIGNENYNLTINQNQIIIQVKNSDYWLIIPQVNGNFVKETNTIKKENGMIYLNKP